MPPLTVMFKTVSTDCNLDCAYCYYRESLEGSRVRRRIHPQLLETFIPQYMEYISDTRVASMAWQGGEPTLAGIGFFEQIVSLQAAHARPGTTISNALQTNAVLIDDDWAAFLKKFGFLVGVSLDGPEHIHNRLRTYKTGRGSFDHVMRGIETLRKHGVTFNILCVLGPHNVGDPVEMMRFYRKLGVSHVQFIPAMDFQAVEPDKPASYLIDPDEYGEFLTVAFDEWYQNGGPTLSVRIFDNFLQSYLGVPNELCVHANRCDAGIVVEYNGDAYPCDFYVHPGWKLGNVVETPLVDVLANPSRLAFVNQKTPLPADCQSCEWLAVCKSGCPRNRTSGDDGQKPDYFCASYKRFFRHGDERLQHLKGGVERRMRYYEAARLNPRAVARTGPNDSCPCGSGEKHKKCCQSLVAQRSYVMQPG